MKSKSTACKRGLSSFTVICSNLAFNI